MGFLSKQLLPCHCHNGGSKQHHVHTCDTMFPTLLPYQYGYSVKNLCMVSTFVRCVDDGVLHHIPRRVGPYFNPDSLWLTVRSI
uniref:Uncharacterized protein n=1 Tax=Arion vulgaris TaxID=1028688 RepID=A0A0B7AJD1_9EUPU